MTETALTSVLAFGSYLLAENFHVSGVLAVVTAGIISGNAKQLLAAWNEEYFLKVLAAANLDAIALPLFMLQYLYEHLQPSPFSHCGRVV